MAQLYYLCLVAKSCLTLATPWTIACQAPLSMGFSRKEYWRGLPFPSPYIISLTSSKDLHCGNIPLSGIDKKCSIQNMERVFLIPWREP